MHNNMSYTITKFVLFYLGHYLNLLSHNKTTKLQIVSTSFWYNFLYR